MSEIKTRMSPPADSWFSFAIRCVAAIAYLIISLAAGHYFDASDSSIALRCMAVAIIASGFIIAFIWTIIWMRRADEYQRLMNYRNLASALTVTMLVFITIHVAHGFDYPKDESWSVMIMPAFACFYTVMGSRPKRS